MLYVQQYLCINEFRKDTKLSTTADTSLFNNCYHLIAIFVCNNFCDDFTINLKRTGLAADSSSMVLMPHAYNSFCFSIFIVFESTSISKP